MTFPEISLGSLKDKWIFPTLNKLVVTKIVKKISWKNTLNPYEFAIKDNQTNFFIFASSCCAKTRYPLLIHDIGGLGSVE